MNAIRLLKSDHRHVEGLFREFDAAGDRAHQQQQWVTEQICTALEIHSDLEEQIFYPAVHAETDERGAELVDVALVEHAAVADLVDEMKSMSTDNPEYAAKFTMLRETVQDHIEEEEGEIFPLAEQALDSADLEALGRQMERRKKTLTLSSAGEGTADRPGLHSAQH